MLKIVMALAVGQSLGVRGLCAEVVLCTYIMCNKIYFNVQGFILNQVQCLQLCLWFCEIDLVWWEASMCTQVCGCLILTFKGIICRLFLANSQLPSQLVHKLYLQLQLVIATFSMRSHTDNYALNDTIIFFVNACLPRSQR